MGTIYLGLLQLEEGDRRGTLLSARIDEEGEERGVGGCRAERLSVVGVVAVAVLAAGAGGSGPGWWSSAGQG